MIVCCKFRNRLYITIGCNKYKRKHNLTIGSHIFRESKVLMNPAKYIERDYEFRWEHGEEIFEG